MYFVLVSEKSICSIFKFTAAYKFSSEKGPTFKACVEYIYMIELSCSSKPAGLPTCCHCEISIIISFLLKDLKFILFICFSHISI